MYHSHVLALIYSSINIYWIPFVSYFFMLANGKGDSCLQMSLEPVEVIPTDLDGGGENLKPRLKGQCSHPSLHRKSSAGKAEPLPLRQTLYHFTDSTSHPKARWPGLGQPSYIPPHSTVTTQCHSVLHNTGYQKAELSRDTGGFLGASGISLRMSKEHFTKRQITWSLFSSLNWSPHLKCTTQILSLLGFSLGPFFFLILLKWIWAWHAEMER